MGKGEELKTTTKLVKYLLETEPRTRDSDNYLYVRVVSKIYPQAVSMPFINVMYNLDGLGLPCFETVRRSRAKIQAEHPELKGSSIVQDFRTANEEIFREYARS